MELVTLSSVSHFRSDTSDRKDRRERRDGQRRRREDAAPIAAAEHAGPSLAFLTQVASQMTPAATTTVNGYTPRAWRCGVIADERA
jgi:hypothetical protein